MSDLQPPEHPPAIDPAYLIGGPERRPIVLVDHDARWAERFRVERGRIERALGASARRIEHIGSTAVPDLVAKPVVDLLVTVPDVEDESGYLPALERAGYVLRVREPGHRMLRTRELDVHVHIWTDDDPAVEEYVLFRDRLRSRAEDRETYAATKRRLAARDWPTVNHYATAKTEVIRRILTGARGEPSPGAGAVP